MLLILEHWTTVAANLCQCFIEDANDITIIRVQRTFTSLIEIVFHFIRTVYIEKWLLLFSLSLFPLSPFIFTIRLWNKYYFESNETWCYVVVIRIPFCKISCCVFFSSILFHNFYIRNDIKRIRTCVEITYSRLVIVPYLLFTGSSAFYYLRWVACTMPTRHLKNHEF